MISNLSLPPISQRVVGFFYVSFCTISNPHESISTNSNELIVSNSKCESSKSGSCALQNVYTNNNSLPCMFHRQISYTCYQISPFCSLRCAIWSVLYHDVLKQLVIWENIRQEFCWDNWEIVHRGATPLTAQTACCLTEFKNSFVFQNKPTLMLDLQDIWSSWIKTHSISSVFWTSLHTGLITFVTGCENQLK